MEAWSELPWWLRLLVALGLMAGGLFALYSGFWRSGSGMLGLGVILLLIGGRSDSERNGYRF